MPQKGSTKTNRKPKSDNALVPGVTLFEKTIREKDDGETDTNRVVRGSAQVEGQQKIIERSVSYHGLEDAIEEVCQWRYERVDGTGFEDADEMTEAAMNAVQG